MADSYKLGGENKKSLSQMAVRKIVQMINDTNLKPGEKLPSEAELQLMLGVSRAVVREATAALGALGIVESRHGQGTYILDFSSHLIKPSTYYVETDVKTLAEVLQVRTIFEVETARIAAQNRTAKDIERLERINEKIALPENTVDERARYDIEFHMAIAQCTKNEVLYRFLQGLLHILLPGRKEVLRGIDAAMRAKEEHEELLQPIREQDEAKAEAAMRKHLSIALESIRRQAPRGENE